jgi:hypothetical protein
MGKLIGLGGMRKDVDFDAVNRAAMPSLPALVGRWLPNGKRQGNEWVSLNPNRADSRLGSFKINLRTGKWSDFATGDRGGDPVSLAAYLHSLNQVDAARQLAQMLGLCLDG